jgi:hypothetical protein
MTLADHPEGCDCFGHKLRTLQFNPKGPATQTRMEEGWSRDMPAYARLRADGIQPRGIDGSAELETRLSYGQLEADMGHLFDAEKGFTVRDLPRVQESFEEAQGSGWSPVGEP